MLSMFYLSTVFRATCRRLYVSFLALLFLFYNFQMFVEEIFMSYLTSFAIKYTGWSVKSGSDVMALYYACQFGAIVLGVAISAVVSPRIILIVDQIIMTVACLLLLLVNVWPDVLWVSAAMAGLGTACSFGGMILWLSNRIAFTGLVSAVAMFGIATGSIVAPTIVGQLFDTVTPLAFVYTLIGSVIAVAVTLVVMFAFDRRYNEELKLGGDSIDSTNGDLSIRSLSDETVDADKTVTYF
jgi:MFS family permease